MKPATLTLSLTLITLPLFGQSPLITEFMADNNDALVLPDGSSPDWIELHNPGADPADLTGWHLTDNDGALTRWTFPAGVTIPAGGYLVVYASGLDLLDPGAPLHTNFQLERNGEYLALVNPEGTVEQDFAPEYPNQIEDFSYGIILGTEETAYFPNPTPGAPNNEAVLGTVEDTKFSVDRGFFDAPFDVVITSDTPGASIYYTTDGSDPTTASTRVDAPDEFTTPSATVTITTTTLLRAFAGKEDFLSTDIDSQTYLFLDEVIGRPEMSTTITGHPTWGPQMRDALLEIPTISLITQEEIPLDEPTVNNPREIPLSIEMIMPDGSRGFQANAGVERFGGPFTFFDGNKKNLRISFKEIYGPRRLRYNLFDDVKYGAEDATDSFDQFLLRNGSHDAIFFEGYARPRNGAFVRNRYFLDRQFEMGHNSLRGKFVHVYLNGVYNGHYHLMERPTADHMAEYFGGDEDDYDVVRGRSGLEYQSGSEDAWETVISNSSNWAVMQEYLDIDNYIDYMLLNFYGGNDHDWYPNHNWVASRRRDPSGRFRFFMWDSDFLNRARLPDGGNTVDNGGPSNILSGLRTIPEFRDRMADRAQKHFFGDGVLSAQSVNEDFNAFGAELATSIIPETARWGNQNTPFYTPDTFQNAISWLANDYPNGDARPRVETVIQHMRAANLFPDVDAPLLSQYGGEVSPGVEIAINHDEGNLYYTTDGSDPRLEDGSINPDAILIGDPFAPNTIIPRASTWKYDDSKVDPGFFWYRSTFDDASWDEGQAPIANGGLSGAPTNTTAFAGTTKGLTFYARKTFNVTDADSFVSAAVNIIYDDGFVVYLNGQEIARENMPPGLVSINTEALANGNEEEYESFPFDVSRLVEGENLIAIEVHNRNINNIDIGFDLEMVGESRNPARVITIDETSTLRTRVLGPDPENPEWSALTEATYITDQPAASGNLVISEIHYHPSEAQNPDAEYIELMNISDQRISLAGVSFTAGISFDFDSQAALEAGERVILVFDEALAQAAFGPGLNIGGVYLSRLSNGGERLTLRAADGSIIEDFQFNDQEPWPVLADGAGFSLVRVAPGAANSGEQPEDWRVSLAPGGTPGTSDSTGYDAASGLSLIEYATGSTSGGVLEFIGQSAIFEYQRVLGADDVSVEVQVSSDLENWTTSGVTLLQQINTPGDTARMRFLLPLPDGNRVFTRLRTVLHQ